MKYPTVMKRIILITALATTLFGFFIILFGLGTLEGYEIPIKMDGGSKLIGGAILMGFGLLSLVIYLQTFKDEISAKK